MPALLNLDHALFILINQTWSFRWLDPLMIGLTHLGDLPLAVAGVAVVAAVLGGWREKSAILVAALLVTIVDFLFTDVLKPHFERLRPFLALDHARLLVAYTDHLSRHGFPSNHAGNSFAVATLLALIYRKSPVSVIALTAAALIAYSRVFIGVHYPSDIFAGAVLGALLATGGYFAWLKIPEKWRCPKNPRP